MATLDRKRPFGTISGDTEGRFFMQDDRYFNANGSPWQPQPDDDAPAAVKAAPAKKPKPAEAPADAQLDAQLGAA